MSAIRVLGFLDVLGFTSRLGALGLEEMHSRYSRLTAYVKEQTGGFDIVQLTDGGVGVGWLEIGHAYFSDTVLFWTDYNKLSLPSFTDLMSEAVCFSLEHGLPLRGTISLGEAVLDQEEDVYLGTPIVEGARTETLQKWIGISFGASFLGGDQAQGFHLRTVLPYKSHYKDRDSELATGMVVDWPRKWRETRNSDVRVTIRALDTEPTAKDYYENTLRFVDFSEQNHDWFTRDEHLEYG